MAHNCENCKFRAHYDKKPNSMLSKFWRWHINVAIGVLVFGELFTFRLAVGIVLILSSVLLIVMGKSFHIRTITHTITTLVRKTWRWK